MILRPGLTKGIIIGCPISIAIWTILIVGLVHAYAWWTS